MAIIIAAIENHKDAAVDDLCTKYLQRLNGPWKTSLLRLPAARVKDPEKQKIQESEQLLKLIKPDDLVILCDERGKTLTSEHFAAQIQQKLNTLRGNLILGIGGAYGFTPEILARYPSIKLSEFTFPHHLARLVLCEQLYRAMCINKGTGYHHA